MVNPLTPHESGEFAPGTGLDSPSATDKPEGAAPPSGTYNQGDKVVYTLILNYHSKGSGPFRSIEIPGEFITTAGKSGAKVYLYGKFGKIKKVVALNKLRKQ